MNNILKQICDNKIADLNARKLVTSLNILEMKARKAKIPRGFVNILKKSVKNTGTGLIAEIKKASPSEGVIRDNFEPSKLALSYAKGGAACLSVLTDKKYFQGDDKFLTEASNTVALPVLRKDFIIDPYQVVESRAIGADCVLIILAAVDDTLASELMQVSTQWEMDVLVEIHDEKELERAEKLGAKLLGINNRDLKSLKIDLNTTKRLSRLASPDVDLVSESGFYSSSDLNRMRDYGVNRFLVGTSLMRKNDVANATSSLLNN